jgi:hypothetical protein
VVQVLVERESEYSVSTLTMEVSMSLPNEVMSMIEDLFEEEMDKLLTLGYDMEKAELLAEQAVWHRMDHD